MLQPDEPQPAPVREEEPWDQFMARQRAQEAIRAAAEVNRIRHDRVQMGIGLDGRRRVAIWDPIALRYNIRDEEQ